jgi:hypothetical protein
MEIGDDLRHGNDILPEEEKDLLYLRQNSREELRKTAGDPSTSFGINGAMPPAGKPPLENTKLPAGQNKSAGRI